MLIFIYLIFFSWLINTLNSFVFLSYSLYNNIYMLLYYYYYYCDDVRDAILLYYFSFLLASAIFVVINFGFFSALCFCLFFFVNFIFLFCSLLLPFVSFLFLFLYNIKYIHSRRKRITNMKYTTERETGWSFKFSSFPCFFFIFIF